MASSLASQLAQVRSHNADRISGTKKADKSRTASYLFPANVAATQDYYTLHGLAKNGWEELCASDSALWKWGQSTGHADLLFGDASKDLDRLTRTQEENRQLDGAIADFFDVIGDSLLDRSAAKCVEWLVRRFRVHEYNVDDVMTLFMPYHETNEFVRMLQIVKLADKPHLAFLLPVQMRSAQLPPSVLISAVTNNPSSTTSLSTLRWLLGTHKPRKFASRQYRSRNVARTFWLSCVVRICSLWSGSADSLQSMSLSRSSGRKRDRRDDDGQLILSVLLPSAVNMLSSTSSSPDDRIVGCMSLCSIAASFDLSEEAASGLLACLAQEKSAASRVRIAILSASAAICTYQERAASFTDGGALEVHLLDEAVASQFAVLISSASTLFDQVCEICEIRALQAQLGAVLAASLVRIENDNDPHDLQKTQILATLKILLGADIIEPRLVALMISNCHSDSMQDIGNILQTLRQRRPDVFDEAVDILKDASGNLGEDSEAKIWNIMTGGQDSSFSTESNALFLGASDAAGNARKVAVSKVLETVNQGAMSVHDPFAKQVIMGALQDEDSAVVETVYAGVSVLLSVATLSEIARQVVNTLRSLQERSRNFTESDLKIEGRHIRFLVEHIFCSDGLDRSLVEWAWETALMPRLLCTKQSRKQSKAFFQILAAFKYEGLYPTLYSKVLSALVGAVDKAIKEDDWARVNVIVVQVLSKHIAEAEDEQQYGNFIQALCHQTSLTKAPSASRSNLRSWAMLVLANTLSRSSDSRKAGLARTLIDLLNRDVGDINVLGDDFFSSGTAFPDTMASFLYKNASGGAIFKESKSFLSYTVVQSLPIENHVNLRLHTSSLAIAQEAFCFCVRLAKADSNCSTQLVSKLLKRYGQNALVFLASIWTKSTGIEDDVQLAALASSRAFLTAFEPSKGRTRWVDFQVMVPSFLLALKHNLKQIRVEALKALQSLAAITKAIDTDPRQGKEVRIYAYDELYGPISRERLRYLETRDASELLQEIVASSESFINDSLFLNSFVARHFTPQKEDGKKEKAFKTALLQYLLSHVNCLDEQANQVSLLETTSATAHICRLESLLPLIRQVIEEHSVHYSDDLLHLLFAAFDRSARRMIDADASGCWTLLMKAIESRAPEKQKYAALALGSGLFSNLSIDKQREAFSRVTNLVGMSASSIPKEVRTLLSALPVHLDVIVSLLYEFRLTASGQTTGQGTGKRPNGYQPDQISSSAAVSILAEVLESLLARKPSPNIPLAAELFEILRTGGDMLLARIGSAEYLMHLSMSNLAAILDVSSQANAAELAKELRIDIIVNIIKMPCRPQTFQQALLLLSAIGRLSPELVMHHAMPIFTFVGTSMLQRDDDFSFTVIEKTLQSILPASASDLKARNEAEKGNRLQLLQRSRNLLCIFTDASTHIPRHRRPAFFQHLVQSLGSMEYLGAVSLLLVDRQAGRISRSETTSDLRDALQLPLRLFAYCEDDIDVLLKAMGDTWHEIALTYEHRDKDPIEMQDHVFLDCVRGIDSEHDQGKVNPSRRLVALLHFARLVALAHHDAIDDERHDETHEQHQARDNIIQDIIQQALRLTKVPDPIIANAAQGALDATMVLVPVGTLRSVVTTLLSTKNADQVKTALSIMVKSIESMAVDDRERASTFIPEVVHACYEVLQNRQSQGEDIQLALQTVKIIAADCTNKEHTALSKGISVLTQFSTGQSLAISLLSLATLALLVQRLGSRLIPKLSEIVDSCSSNVVRIESPTPARVDASLDVLAATVKSVPTFIPMHLRTIFQMYVTQPTLLQEGAARRLLSAIVASMQPSEVLQALYTFYETSDRTRVALPLFCLSAIQQALKKLDNKKALQHYKGVFRFIVQIMDSRRLSVLNESTSMSRNNVIEVEEKAIDTFLRLVLKLNEGTFRPLFLRLCDWALLDLVEDEEDEAAMSSKEQSHARQVVLYKVLNNLLSQLGELVVHYYANVLDGTIDTLQNMAQRQSDDEALWTPLMESVKISARVDRGAFWNEGRVNKIVPLLAAQLTTDVVHSSPSAERSVGDAISALCQAVATESSVKEANNQLLAFARDAESATSTGGYSRPSHHHARDARRSHMKTRIAAIRAMERLWSTKGCDDALLNLVPETVPSVAELLQETDQDVQEAMMSLVVAIEAILGESLDTYLQ